MPRARLISPEFWTSEAVIDCAPMTRLLLLGLSNFADDFGALPLRPRTIRLQVFPGDSLDDEQVRAMIEELAARGLVRRYTVEGVDYLSIVDWEIHQRVGRRARRRYPAGPSRPDALAPRTATMETAPGDHVANQGPPPDHGKAKQNFASTLAAHAAPAPFTSPDPGGQASTSDAAAEAAWIAAVEQAVRHAGGADVPEDLALHAARWRAQGRDLAHDVLPAIDLVVHDALNRDQRLRLDVVDDVMGGMAAADRGEGLIEMAHVTCDSPSP